MPAAALLNTAALNNGWPSPVVAASVAIVAAATLSSSADHYRGASAAATGRAVVTATAKLDARSSVTLLGRGLVGGNPYQVHTSSAAPAGRGVLSGSPRRTQAGTAALVGAASLVAAPAPISGGATLTAVAVATATATLQKWQPTAAPVGRAVLSATPSFTRSPPAPLALVGRTVIRAEPKINSRHFAYASAVGAMSVTIDNAKVLSTYDAAPMVATATATATAFKRQHATANAVGEASLPLLDALRSRGASAAMVAAATMVATGVRNVKPTATLTGTADIITYWRSDRRPLYFQIHAARGDLLGDSAVLSEATYVHMARADAASAAVAQADGVRITMGEATLPGVAEIALRGIFVNLAAPETGGQEFVRPEAAREFARPGGGREWGAGVMALLGTVEKQSREVEDYTFNYDENLSDTDEVTTIVATEVSPAGLTASPAIVPGGRAVTFFATGGVSGTKYKVTLVVSTTEGRTLEDELYIKVKDI